ncbi:MAG: hypothetical protein AAF479_10500, partial [Pseudomonadota bacterium]
MLTGTNQTHVETARPYCVIVASEPEFLRSVRRAHRDTGIRFHGRLFGIFPSDLAEDFSRDGQIGLGCLTTDPVQRDYRPAQYLARVLWIGRDRPAAFLFDPADNRYVRGQILSDGNARLVLLGDPNELLTRLAEPLQSKRGGSLKPPQKWAWIRCVRAEGEHGVSEALSALESNWEDPTQWTVPKAGEYAI